MTYQSRSYYYRSNTNTIAILEKINILHYKNNLLTEFEECDVNKNSKVITHYEYFPGGLLKRRRIVRVPEPELKGRYAGGPASDDDFYKYKLYKSGLIKILYRIVGGKTYKIATYKYK